MLRRLVVLVFAFALVGTADPASAAWGVTGAGPARAQAVTIPQAATPAAVKTNPEEHQYLPVYTVSWTSTKHSGGRGVIGYQVRRTQWQGSGLVVTSGTCAGTTVNGMPNVFVPSDPNAATQSCTDLNAYNSGTVSYTVTPVMGRWTGRESASSPSYS